MTRTRNAGSRANSAPRNQAASVGGLVRAAFCFCELELCDFFRDHAELHHNDYSARVHVALYDTEVVGYYWLIAQSHLAGKFSSELEPKFDRIFFAPCVYLGMLAVRWDLQGNKIGYALMMHAFGQTLKVAEYVGLYALTLEAINESKAKTYAKWNFQRFVRRRVAHVHSARHHPERLEQGVLIPRRGCQKGTAPV